MCKHFVEIEDGKITKIKGKLKRGLWAFCLECGIQKSDRRKTKRIEKLLRKKQ